MSTLSIFEHPDVRILGWTLLHFVWQGAVVALALAAANACLQRRSARTRYAAASAALLAMLSLPIVTFFVLRAASPAADGGTVVPVMAPRHQPVRMIDADLTPAPWPRVQETVATALPWLVAGWALGVLALSVRFLGGWLLVCRLDRSATPVADWQVTLDRLRARLRVSRAVRVCESLLVEVPTVVGWLRPLILLPSATLAGLTPFQLEALLVHELAHIRRLDYLANLVQTLAETLLFYHPAVWWTSHRMRVEREHCCDDAAVAVCGDPIAYARTLAALAGLRSPAVALAATGGSLFERVKRLLADRAPQEPRAPRWTAALLAIAILPALATLVLLEQSDRTARAAQREEPSAVASAAAAEGSAAPRTPATRAESQQGEGSIAAGPSRREELTLETIMELSENGVTPEYLDQMEAAGYRRLGWQTLIELRSSGVMPELVEELRRRGHAEVSPEQLIELANQGVTPDYLREISEAGFGDVSVEQLAEARSQGVTPDFVREMKELGVPARSLDDCVELVSQGVTPDFVREMKAAGYDKLPLGMLIELRDHGVDAEFANEMKQAGFEQLSPAQLIEARDRGVSGELLRRFKGGRR